MSGLVIRRTERTKLPVQLSTLILHYEINPDFNVALIFFFLKYFEAREEPSSVAAVGAVMRARLSRRKQRCQLLPLGDLNHASCYLRPLPSTKIGPCVQDSSVCGYFLTSKAATPQDHHKKEMPTP